MELLGLFFIGVPFSICVMYIILTVMSDEGMDD
jgi:hypothetical protein